MFSLATKVMRKYALILFLWFQYLIPMAQDQAIKDIAESLRKSSPELLLKYCKDPLNLKMDSKPQSLNKKEATLVLQGFFQKEPSSNFNYIHQGSSVDGMKYCIGKYITEETSYRVLLLMKVNTDGMLLIENIGFTKEL